MIAQERIVSRHLVDRLGELPPDRLRAVEDEAAQAFMLGVPPHTAYDIGMSLFWRAHGRPISYGLEELTHVLAPSLPSHRRRDVVGKLEVACRRLLTAGQPITCGGPVAVAGLNAVWGSDAYFGALLREALALLT